MWKTAGCAVQGRGHKRQGIPCQDAVAFAHAGAVHASVLADGAGSAARAEDGAACVTATAAAWLCANFDEIVAETDGRHVKEALLDTLRAALRTRAEELGCDVQDLASTFLAAAANGTQFFLAHIGDGVIGYLKGDDLRVASAPDNGEFANATTFVTSPDALARMRIYRGELADIAGFLLLSDGSEQSFYQKQQKILAPRLAYVLQEALLLDVDAFDARLAYTMTSVIIHQTQDDCSLALLVRRAGALQALEDLPARQRMEAYGIAPGRSAKRRLRLHDRLYTRLTVPHTAREIARIGCWHHGAKKKLARLIATGLLTKCGNTYVRACLPIQ